MAHFGVGIISFAHMHAYSYYNCLLSLGDVEVIGVYDDNIARGRRVVKQCKNKNVRFYDNLDDLLNKDEDINAVVICSENTLHKKHVIMSATAKKHILCEKPLSTTVEDGKEMIRTCRENNVKLMTAFPCRYSLSMINLRRLVENGEIGAVLCIRGTNRGQMPDGWFVEKKLSGGGAVIDHTVHVVDLMRWLLKEEVKKVYAEIGNLIYKDLEVEDCGILSLEFGNGIFATLDTSWSRPKKSFPFWGDVTMKVVGVDGIIEMDMFNQKIDVYSEKYGKGHWVYWGDNIDLAMIKDFIDSVRENKPVPITGEDGLRAVEVSFAAYLSAKEKKPIELPLSFI